MNTDLVWYVAYGSNLSQDRFHCYITGGMPEGSDKMFEGCRDTTLPREIKSEILDRELYFAENSQSWQGMGVSFISKESSPTAKTYAVKYLITREQLEDLAKQETSTQRTIVLDFERTIEEGFTIFRQAWYGKLLFLGLDDDVPVFTLTSETDRQNITRPSDEYIRTIARGLEHQHALSTAEIALYLEGKAGVVPLQAHEIYAIIVNRNTSLEDAVRQIMNSLIEDLNEAVTEETKKEAQKAIDRFAQAYYGRVNFG